MDDDTREKVMDLVVVGLVAEGAQHKQWYLEQIAMVLGVSIVFLGKHLEWELGVKP